MLYHRRSAIALLGGIGASVVVPRSFAEAHETADRVIARILDVMRETRGLTDWEPRTSLFRENTSYYCNEYVASVLRKAGAATWKPIKREGVLLDRYTDPLAREWAEPTFKLDGWRVVFAGPTDPRDLTGEQIVALREPGDVVAGKGHVGIKGDGSASLPEYYSASSITGAIERNDWSEKPINQGKHIFGIGEYQKKLKEARKVFTVRRFVGV